MIRNDSPTRQDDRAVSVAVTHVLAIGITTILIVGLLTAAGGLAEDEQERSAREQLQMIGSSMANGIEQADDLGRQGANVSVRKEFEGTVSGKSYTVDFETDRDAATLTTNACLVLNLTNSDISTTVGVSNQSPVTFEHLGSGTVRIVSEPGGTVGDAPYDPSILEQIGVGGEVYDLPPTKGVIAEANRPPHASLRMDPSMPMLGDVIIFNASQSVDPEGNIVKYVWNISDTNGNTVLEKETVDPVLAVPSPQDSSLYGLEAGKYRISLTVVDNKGLDDEDRTVFGVAGLVRNGQALAFDSADGDQISGEDDTVPGGVSFDVVNKHNYNIEIRRVFIHPENDDITRIDDDPTTGDDDDGSAYHEIKIADGFIEEQNVGEGLEIHEGGLLLTGWGHVSDDDDDDDYPTIGDGDSESVKFTEFRASDPSNEYDPINISGEPIEVRLFYYESVNDMYYTSRFHILPNGSYFDRQSSYGYKNWANAPDGDNKTKKLQIDNSNYGTSDSYKVVATSEGWNKSNITAIDANPSDLPNKKPKADVTYPHVDSTQWFVVEMTLSNDNGPYVVRWFIEVEP